MEAEAAKMTSNEEVVLEDSAKKRNEEEFEYYEMKFDAFAL